MPRSELAFDLTGCTVAHVNWPARGIRLLLKGETAEGRPVAGAALTFGSVENQYEVREFLSGRRRMVRTGSITRNTVDRNPLKLPAELTHLKLSRARQADYSDAAFTDAHGTPPAVGPTQHLCLFALQANRFKDRKPFPIIFERWSLTDASGKMLTGAEEKSGLRWSHEEYQRLGMQFFEAIVTDNLTTAWNMLSKACRKRLDRSDFGRRLRDYRGCARRFGQPLDQLRAYMSVNVADDEEILWQSVQGWPAEGPRESARAQITLGSEFLREELGVYVVEEDGAPRLYLT